MARPRDKAQEGRVRAVGRGGDGVVELDGGLWMVADVLPGERVLARRTERRGGVVRGKLVRVLSPHAERVTPECPHQGACGGCPLMHASRTLEEETKRAWVADVLTRLGAPGVEVEWFAAPEAARYRTRARLFWTRSARGALHAGFRRARSQQIVDIPECLVLRSSLDRAWRGLRRTLGAHLSGQGEVALSLGAEGKPAVVLRASGAQPPALYAACEAWAASGEVAGIALWVGEGTQPAVWGQPEERLEGTDGAPLVGAIGGFSQANAAVNAILVGYVADLAQTQDARVHELYAGHGNFSVALARGSREYSAVEQDPEAAARCVDNTRARGLVVKVVTGDAAAHVGKGPLDVLVLDPPRTGARGVLAAAAVARAPKRIVYVSCNLATLERDLREALEAGYRIDRVLAFDMFPRSAQLETVVRLVRS